MRKVIFLCKKRINGYEKSIGLFISASFVSNYLNSIGICSKVVIVTDGNDIDREVSNYKPTHVIIEALWVTPDKIRELLSLKHHKKIQWLIRLHSKIPFLANEGMAMDWLSEYGKIKDEHSHFNISGNSIEIVLDLFKLFNLPQHYLPNIYWPENYSETNIEPKKSHLEVGCFGAIRPLKNQLIQAIAAIEYGNEKNKIIHFHINADRQEMSGDKVYKNIKALFSNSRHVLKEHGWLDHEHFIRLVKTMDVGLQVSFSETFNIVAADFAWNNVAIIGSREIDWLPDEAMADPNSSQDIKEKLEHVFNNKREICEENKESLQRFNKKSKIVWEKFLD